MPTMTRAEFKESVRIDPLNFHRIRNRHNTPCEAYNCGGFALSIYDWICPYICTDHSTRKYDLPDDAYTDDARETMMIELINDGFEESDIEEEILQYDVEFLLNKYPFLKTVELSDCKPNETLIAYRIFIRIDEELGLVEDTDFHFKVRIHGFWFEKMGTDPIRLCELDEHEPWRMGNTDTMYTSRIVYFTIDQDYIKEQLYEAEAVE